MGEGRIEPVEMSPQDPYDTTTPFGMGYLAYEFYAGARMSGAFDPVRQSLTPAEIEAIVASAVKISIEDGGDPEVIESHRSEVEMMLIDNELGQLAVRQEPPAMPGSSERSVVA
jgi:hypothetical protein